MKRLKIGCLLFSALFTGSFSLGACVVNEPSSSSESSQGYSQTESSEKISDAPFSSQEESSRDDSSSESSASSSDENSSTEDEEAEVRAILDAAFALAPGQSLTGIHQLTGVVTTITSKSGKPIIYILVLDKTLMCFNIQGSGMLHLKVGDTATVSGKITNYQGTVEFDNGCILLSPVDEEWGDSDGEDSTDGDPYVNMSETEFYAHYTPATSNQDALYRSAHGFMSGSLTVPDQAPTLSPSRPKNEELYIRNSDTVYVDGGNGYVVKDADGQDAFTVYRSGAYITLEEVAAYVYAFGDYPANYTTSKKTDPEDSVFGEYLRLNHTKFSGDVDSYPYEPELPNIKGCGGTLQYYEMDIGTTGTDCDPDYDVKIYNDGSTITRGAARIVYGKNDLNGNGVYEVGELHVFYTYNHYNDFQEYLNYQGGWGETFGNITGGGVLSSKNPSQCKPTPYVSVSIEPLPSLSALACFSIGYDYKTLLKSYA